MARLTEKIRRVTRSAPVKNYQLGLIVSLVIIPATQTSQARFAQMHIALQAGQPIGQGM